MAPNGSFMLMRVGLTLLASVLAVLCFNAFVLVPFKSDPWDYHPPASAQQRWTVDPGRRLARAQRLAAALAIPTVSHEDGSQDGTSFIRLHEHIRSSFPRVHSSPFITRTVVNEYSLLYHVQGNNRNSSEKPYMLTAHMDVVPASTNGTAWKYDPFGGKILDGNIIYGRGAIDDKQSVMGILEALEFLLEAGYEPKRSFYIGFGHDEEISGIGGAKRIAQELRDRGVKELDFVLDEGFFILDGFLDGIHQPVAVIGVSQKGYVTLEMSVEGTPGHSSLPPKSTSIGTLAGALARLEQNPQPNLFGSGPELDLFRSLAPFASGIHRFVFANLWLFSPLLSRILSAKEETDSVQRTTTAITVFNAGFKSNVVPGRSSALVNHRIHPSQTLEQVMAHDQKVMADPRVTITVQEPFYPPMKVSPYGPHVPQYALIARSVKQVFPSTIIAPACSPAYTDLFQYQNFSSNLYRLAPNVVTPVTQKGMHGNDEQITISEYHDVIQVYVRLIANADQVSSESVATAHTTSDL